MPSTSSTPDARRIFVELRMGDVLEVGGARSSWNTGRGRVVVAPTVRKTPAALRPLPSLQAVDDPSKRDQIKSIHRDMEVAMLLLSQGVQRTPGSAKALQPGGQTIVC
jgi:hypothetical protein